MNQEKDVGSLKVCVDRLQGTQLSVQSGKRADFIILDRNIFSEGLKSLQHVHVTRTFFRGREVWRMEEPSR